MTTTAPAPRIGEALRGAGHTPQAGRASATPPHGSHRPADSHEAFDMWLMWADNGLGEE